VTGRAEGSLAIAHITRSVRVRGTAGSMIGSTAACNTRWAMEAAGSPSNARKAGCPVSKWYKVDAS